MVTNASETETARVQGYLEAALDLLFAVGAVNYVGHVPHLHPEKESRIELELLCRARVQLSVGDLLNPYSVRAALERWRNELDASEPSSDLTPDNPSAY